MQRQVELGIEVLADKSIKAHYEGGPILVAWQVWCDGRYKARCRPSTVRTYKRACAKADERWQERAPTSGMIEVWCNEMLSEGLSPGTVRIYLQAVAAVTLAAARVTSTREAHVLADAFAAARRPPKARRLPRALPDGELAAMIDACETPAEQAYVRLMSVCGLRPGEVMALQDDDVQMQDGSWRVLITKTRGVGEGASAMRKNRDDHIVYLDDATAMALAWTIDNRESVRPELGREARKSDGYIFPWGWRRVVELQQRLRTVAAHFKSWHQLRHTGATAVYAMTGSVGKVQEYLGDKTASAAMCYAAPLRAETGCDAQAIAAHLGAQKCVKECAKARTELRRPRKALRSVTASDGTVGDKRPTAPSTRDVLRKQAENKIISKKLTMVR